MYLGVCVWVVLYSNENKQLKLKYTKNIITISNAAKKNIYILHHAWHLFPVPRAHTHTHIHCEIDLKKNHTHYRSSRYYGPAFSTEFRVIVKNLSSRVNWKVCIFVNFIVFKIFRQILRFFSILVWWKSTILRPSNHTFTLCYLDYIFKCLCRKFEIKIYII